MDFIPLSQMIFWTSFWCTFSHENGSTEGASLHVTWKQKRISEILFSGFWVLLTDLTVKLWGKINLKEACLWKHCCMGTKPWECSLRVIQGSCHNQNHHRQIASYFIFFFLLLTLPDNNIKVSDTTRKKCTCIYSQEYRRGHHNINCQLLQAQREWESSLFL